MRPENQLPIRRTISGSTIPAGWQPYMTQIMQGQMEEIHSIKWDTQTYTSGTTTALSFFQTFNSDKGVQNGLLPFQNPFLVKAIGVFFKHNFTNTSLAATTATVNTQTGIIQDLILLCNNGVLNFTINEKNYGPFPLIKLAAGMGYGGILSSGNSGQSSFVSYPQLGDNNRMALFTLNTFLVLPAQTPAILQMAWNSAQTLSGDRSIGLYLEGAEARGM